MVELLSERHRLNRERIRAFVQQRNLNGAEISKGHAATALSNTRKEQLLVELLMEVLTQAGREEYALSDRAHKGFLRLTEPRERHYNYDKETKTWS
jgi:hypothetical protein